MTICTPSSHRATTAEAFGPVDAAPRLLQGGGEPVPGVRVGQHPGAHLQDGAQARRAQAAGDLPHGLGGDTLPEQGGGQPRGLAEVRCR